MNQHHWYYTIFETIIGGNDNMNQLGVTSAGSKQSNGSGRRVSRAWPKSFLTYSRQLTVDESTLHE